MNIYFKWILWFILAELIVSLIEFVLRKKITKFYHYLIIALIKFILALAFAFLPLGGPIFLRPVQPLLLALYVVVFSETFADIIFAFIIKKTNNKFTIRKLIELSLTLIYFIVGTINMGVVKPNYHIVESTKVNRNYKFAFISDAHIASSQSFEITKKYVDEINSIDDLDFVLLGGDIVDDYTSKEEMENVFSLFKNFNTKVFYIYGNHDKQKEKDFADGLQYTKEELRNAIESNGIIILEDEYYDLDSNFTILGRVDLSDKENRKDNLNEKSDKFVVLFDHQPTDIKSLEKIKIHVFKAWFFSFAFKAGYWRPRFQGLLTSPIAFVTLTYP